MNPEEQEAIRKDREAKVRSTWEALAMNPDFKLVFEHDLQVHFPFFSPSFQSGDGFNPHAAAQRDGQKAVIGHIHRRILKAESTLEQDEDTPPKPTTAL